MGVDLQQKGDGSLALYNESDGKIVGRIGGPKTPTPITAASFRLPTKAVVTLGQPGAANTTGGLLNWSNPEGVDCFVDGFAVVITTAGLGSADFGTSSNFSVGSTNLITQVALSATGAFDNITDKGASGKSRQLLTSSMCITGSANASNSGLAGFAIIQYTNL